MRRAICYCEPSHMCAGQVGTWTFVYTHATNLPKGTRLKFDLCSKGREIDWETPTTNLKAKGNQIFLKMPDGTIVEGREVEVPDSLVPQFEFTLPQAVSGGTALYIVMGAKTASKEGNRVQTSTQRRRPFHLLVDTSGKGKWGEPEVFHVDITGGELHTVKILTPSQVAKNKRFDLVLRFEDVYGNLTSNAPEDTLIEVSYDHLRENLNWKLFVPETGFISVPNLYFNEEGIYTIRLKNLYTGEEFRSWPIHCVTETPPFLFWGVLHGESEKIDSTESIDACLRHFRDEKAFNFYAISPFEDSNETPNEIWKSMVSSVVEFDEADRFIALSGFQWAGEPKKEGLRQILFLKEQKQLIRKKETKGSSLEKLYKASHPKDFISIVEFSMAKEYCYNFEEYNPDFERLAEIYNAWGSSECTESQGNPFPIKGSARTGGIPPVAEGSLIGALNKGARFGFIGGGLDDRGIFEPLFDSDQAQYPPGMTAIMADGHTHSEICAALYDRRCYATTGERIVLNYEIAGAKIGTEVSTLQKPGLLLLRHIPIHAAGTKPLVLVELIRNGEVICQFEPNAPVFLGHYDDLTPLKDCLLTNKKSKEGFVYYYVRVTQEDGHMAWGSPIWVDYSSQTQLKKTKTADSSKKSKSASKEKTLF